MFDRVLKYLNPRKTFYLKHHLFKVQFSIKQEKLATNNYFLQIFINRHKLVCVISSKSRWSFPNFASNIKHI